MSRSGAETVGDAESKAGSRLWAVSTEPDTGLELTNYEIMTWAEAGRLNDWASFHFIYLFKKIYFYFYLKKKFF